MRSVRKVKVAVIGGAGFLGSHLVDYLVEDRGCEVLVLDNLISGHREFIHKQARFEWCDITQPEDRLRDLLAGCEYIFNYAAEPYVPTSFDRPLQVLDINAFGALKVLNAAHAIGVKGILQVSSAEIYGDQAGKINEVSKIEPHSTYGAAKAAIDFLVQVRWREAKVPAIVMRQFNCYGPRETHEYVIPVIIDQLAHSNTVRLGNNSSRDFQYAKDAVRMAVELLEKGEFGEVYNAGSEQVIKIYDLAHLVGKLMGYETIEIVEDEVRKRPWEVWHLQSDNSKLYSVIDRRPETLFEQGLRATIEDYRAHGWVYQIPRDLRVQSG